MNQASSHEFEYVFIVFNVIISLPVRSDMSNKGDDLYNDDLDLVTYLAGNRKMFCLHLDDVFWVHGISTQTE